MGISSSSSSSTFSTLACTRFESLTSCWVIKKRWRNSLLSVLFSFWISSSLLPFVFQKTGEVGLERQSYDE
jgi:hypothetical protein